MKSLQRLCAAVALTLVLTLPVFAGGMDTGPGVSSPPPAPAPATTRGDMHTGMGVTDAAGDPFTEAMLSLLEGVLALV